jgi:hypothetical protein
LLFNLFAQGRINDLRPTAGVLKTSLDPPADVCPAKHEVSAFKKVIFQLA